MRLSKCECCGQETEVLEFADLPVGALFNWVKPRGIEVINDGMSGDKKVHPLMKLIPIEANTQGVFTSKTDYAWTVLDGQHRGIVYKIRDEQKTNMYGFTNDVVRLEKGYAPGSYRP